MLSKKDVEYIASLSRIHLAEGETEQLTRNLADILGYIDQLKKVDVSDVDPTSHVLPIHNVFREDVPKPSLSTEEVMKMAVEHLDGSFKVPQVIE